MIGRRGVIQGAAGLVGVSACSGTAAPQGAAKGAGDTGAAALRPLGRTGIQVEAVSLGGEGVLRTTGRDDEAVAMIEAAFRLGVRYCDTAPAYASSQDYYGAAFRRAPHARPTLTLASKTHERTRDGALRLLDDSLRKLGTDHLDLWQLHDLRTTADLDAIFGPGGAIEAVEQAKRDGRIRFVGITGHHDPRVLVDAMGRYAFDTVLCAMNPSDPLRSPFLTTVVPEARRRGMGVIGMKALGVGRIVRDRTATVEEALRYAARFADTVIVGCSSPREVEENLAIGRALRPMDDAEAAALEQRFRVAASRYDDFKG